MTHVISLRIVLSPAGHVKALVTHVISLRIVLSPARGVQANHQPARQHGHYGQSVRRGQSHAGHTVQKG